MSNEGSIYILDTWLDVMEVLVPFFKSWQANPDVDITIANDTGNISLETKISTFPSSGQT